MKNKILNPNDKRVSWRNLRVFIPHNPSAILGIFKSLRNRNFAIYFAGTVVSLTGAWMQQVAMGWLIYNMTNSIFMLSLAVFLAQIPNLIVTPFTGVFSDRFNRRKILLVTQSLMMIQAFTLAILVGTGTITISIIFALSLFSGLVISFDAPARQSLYATIVPHEDLSNAIALNSTAINSTRFIGPAIGGVVISKWGETACFLINGISFFFILGALYLIRTNSEKPSTPKTGTWRGILDGFSYAKNTLPIRVIIILMLIFSFSGIPFPLLLPAFVKGQMGGDAEILGNMMSFVGAGSMTAALYLAARKSVFGLGRVIMAACMTLGVGLIAISHIKNPTIGYFLCFPIGFGMIATAASCNTMLQSLTDDHMRGRVMSIFTMAFFGMPPVGSLVQGWLAGIFSYETVILASGIVCVTTALVFERYRAKIRNATCEIYARHGIVPPQIAEALKESSSKRI